MYIYIYMYIHICVCVCLCVYVCVCVSMCVCVRAGKSWARRSSVTCVSWLIHMCVMTHLEGPLNDAAACCSWVSRKLTICVFVLWLIRLFAMIRSHVCHDSFWGRCCGSNLHTTRMCMCAMTQSRCHESFTCAFLCVYLCMYVYRSKKYIYIHIYTYIYIYIYIHIYLSTASARSGNDGKAWERRGWRAAHYAV